MGRFKRYRTAWSRHHRSRGFGIHSPFAFRFVREVLGQRLPYYCYEQLESLRARVVQLDGGRWRHNGVIKVKDAKQLFRITNEFNPAHILQITAGHAVTSASMLAVSSTSHLWLHQPELTPDSIAGQVLAPYGDRIHVHRLIEDTIIDYETALAHDEMPFVLVDGLAHDSDTGILADFLQRSLAHRAVVIMRGIHRSDTIRQLWLQCKRAMPMGQTYTNEKTAILIATPKLQREDFFLWL